MDNSPSPKTTIPLTTYDRSKALDQRNAFGASTAEQHRIARLLLLSPAKEKQAACYSIGNSDLFIEERHRREAQRVCDVCPAEVALACLCTGVVERRVGTWLVYLNGRPRSTMGGDKRGRKMIAAAWRRISEVTGYSTVDLIDTFGDGIFGLREALEHFCGSDRRWWVVLREMLPDAG